MMLYKAAGAAVLLGSAFVAGRSLSAGRRAQTVQIGGFLRLFRAIRAGIAHERAPVGEMLARVDREVAVACGGGAVPAGEGLLEWCSSCAFLSEELSRLVTAAARGFGRGYREEQLDICDRCIEALEALHRESAARQREQTGLVGRLLMVAASGAVILLL